MQVKYKQLVTSSYDTIAERLASHTYDCTHVTRWLQELGGGLGRGARVLDLGCGAGKPHTAWLTGRFQVIGVDISRRQLQLARRLAPNASLIQADMTALAFPPSCFDAVAAVYSIIHVPRDEHSDLLRRIYGWLKPKGKALVVLGGGDTPIGIEADWFGAPMYWSHFDSGKSLDLVREAGFDILAAAMEPDSLDSETGAGSGATGVDGWRIGPCHLFVLAAKKGEVP